jgi:hypothetical protein
VPNRAHAGSADFWQNGYIFYYDIASNIAAGKGLWIDGNGRAMRPPIYPGFLALAALVGGHYMLIVIPQAVFGAGTVLCAFLIGMRFQPTRLCSSSWSCAPNRNRRQICRGRKA